MTTQPAPATEETGERNVIPISIACDWGDCDETAVGFRNEVDDHGWLPVCTVHYEAEPNKTLIAKFVLESALQKQDVLAEAAKHALIELEDRHVVDNQYRMGLIGKQALESARHTLRAALGDKQ
jgi:hypothetical protein